MHSPPGFVPSPFLQLDGISKRFGRTDVLQDVNLSVVDGEFLCFLGPSGCGKSTLLRIIAGLETQSGGRILKQGSDISHAAPAQRDIGILFQSYALFPNLSVFDNVAYGLVNRGIPKAEIRRRVAELLALVGLPDTGSRLPGQLSGGQQQRIALARALAPAPGLLLLDEPLSALDAKVRLHLRQQIKELQNTLTLTTIMVTHDQEEALTMADRIVVMNHGVIEQVGTPLDIYHRPATRFVADFIGKMNFLPATAMGNCQVKVGDTVFYYAGKPAVGGTASILGFRPEEVCAAAWETAAGGNRFIATVRGVEFLGLAWRARLDCPALGKQEVLADFSSSDARRMGLQAGMSLQLAVEAEHLHLFPEPAASEAAR